ncbi:NuA4 domain containing protein [Naviculisporaceae sp. PSN 640]
MAETSTPAKTANAAGGSSGANNANSSGAGNSGAGTDGAGASASGTSGGVGGGAAGGNNTAAGAGGGIPYYEKQRQHLKELINRKRTLEKKIVTLEESIYSKETDYLENTPGGNIITGFDNYTKGTSNAAAQRRKTGLTDANRVFSRSSVSYNPNAQQEAQTPGGSTTHSTPGSLAPTPLSTSFKDKDRDGGASGVPTPTSATAGKATSSKKGKKTTSKASGAASSAASRAASAGADDSETDSKEAGGATKKIRTNFGASRKN